MSFDLGFWHEDAQSSVERAAEIYDRLTDGEDGVVPGAPAVDSFFTDVLARFGDLTVENMDESPWTSPLYRTSECVIANIAYSRSQEVAPVLRRLANAHGLTVFDPQKQEVHHPAVS
ncbi:hypothetical protein [Phytohabitans houttuyneae]|uniref:Uncharacterized protein n=1 Tax=Phytohabitans houttuyneae TaxID=1076126 RepID=A0A6V8KHC6_9ACTN|nr:hypothetical protein [Phytohabitans houttuyneae]GFJ81509.1 hypothetical protein Phou_056890 [Phytohabitans houttuyneae]